MISAWTKLLLVEDHPELGPALQRHLQNGKSAARDVRLAQTLAAAKRALEDFLPDIIVLDVLLPDGDGLELIAHIEALEVRPRPLLVSMSGAATPAQAFHLAQRGVRAFVQKPFEPSTVEETIDEVLATSPELGPIVRSCVGHEGVRELEAKVRQMMVDEALARARGSRRGAAKILKVSRQLLQHILRS